MCGRPSPHLHICVFAGDFEEARRSFGELGAPFFGYQYVRRLVLRAMEAATDKDRELASRLLSLLYGDGSLSHLQISELVWL